MVGDPLSATIGVHLKVSLVEGLVLIIYTRIKNVLYQKWIQDFNGCSLVLSYLTILLLSTYLLTVFNLIQTVIPLFIVLMRNLAAYLCAS